MKKYIYSIFVALLFVVGCDNEEATKADVKYFFEKFTAETTNNSAVAEVLAYMTVDGAVYRNANIYLEYYKSDDKANYTTVSDSVEGVIPSSRIFTIDNLEASTIYWVRVVIDGGAEYGSKSEIFMFTTTAAESITCDATVDAKGIKATVKLSNVAYFMADVKQQIAFIKVEYSRADMDAWSAVEVAGSSIKNGKVDISIPKSGDSYLEENSDYKYRVTITPEDGKLNAVTTHELSFKTTYASITATVAKPQLSYSDSGITIEPGIIAVHADGVTMKEYDTYIYFHKQGDNLWEEYDVTDGDSVIVPINKLQSGTTYEAKVSIMAGSKHEVRESSIATITTPQSEVPIVPDPPVGGDTSSIAGVWHLTSWRGATPSFEVYMDITATGGITLYQRIDSLYWDVYQSAANIVSGVISGVYTDNVAWGASYNLSISGDTMTWISTVDSTDISIYTRSTLPTSMPTAPTRAAQSSERFL